MIRIRIKQFTKIQKQLEDPKGLIKYSNNMQNVYQNIAEYNPIWCNILYMIANMIRNKELNQTVTKLLIRRIMFLSYNLISQYLKMLR